MDDVRPVCHWICGGTIQCGYSTYCPCFKSIFDRGHMESFPRSIAIQCRYLTYCPCFKSRLDRGHIDAFPRTNASFQPPLNLPRRLCSSNGLLAPYPCPFCEIRFCSSRPPSWGSIKRRLRYFEIRPNNPHLLRSVSYTHLTLPTILLV